MTGSRIDYGTTAKIGVLLPSSNATTEPQFQTLAPDGVTYHFTRLELTSSDQSDVIGMADRAEEGAALLAQANVGLIVFHCTAATTIEGADDEIIQRITKASGLPATTTSKSVVAGLRAVGARRVVLVTPYPPHINKWEVAFFNREGFEVPREAGLGITSGLAMFDPTPEDWCRHAAANRDPTADAYFLSCAATRATDAIADIEADLGKPVLTSNSATLWHSLRMAGVEPAIDGFGTLLAGRAPAGERVAGAA